MPRKNQALNQWMRLNNILFIYKVIGLSLVGLSVLLTILCFYLAYQAPVVIQQKEDDFTYFVGKRRKVNLTENNIKHFVSNYIRLRYKWDKLDPNAITENIDPLVTDGFKKQTWRELKRIKDHDFKGKSLKQDVSGIEVRVSKTKTIAIFDRILRVGGIPLLIPTQISFHFVRGRKSVWNQAGIFINGVTLHENR